MAKIQELVEGVKTGRKLQIRGYVKSKSGSRLTEEISDVIIDCNLPDYPTLLRKAKTTLQSFPQNALREISSRHKATPTQGEEALNEVTDSIIKRLNRTSSDIEPDGMIHHTDWIHEDPKSGYIYFKGKTITEMVQKEGSYKKVNSKPKTRVKREIEGRLPTQMKTWKVHKDNLDKVSLV